MEMDFLNDKIKGSEGMDLDESSFGVSNVDLPPDLNPRSKTSLRMNYEAQVQVIRNQTGNLEDIRTSLGLSQRKMAQLLMVDPSAWTRWTKDASSAPPHIWRALQWYMALKEKIPGLTPQYFLGQDPKVLHQKALKMIESEREQREEKWSELNVSLKSLENENLALKKQQKFLFVALISVSLLSLLKILGM